MKMKSIGSSRVQSSTSNSINIFLSLAHFIHEPSLQLSNKLSFDTENAELKE